VIVSARAVFAVLIALAACEALPAESAQSLLERMRGAYAALGSYSDTGTVTLEEQPIGSTMLREEYTFTTRFAVPRRFYFEFRKGASAGAERFVVWCPGEQFHSWWSATGVAEKYASGEGANAFAVATLPTAGAALLIPPLLFQKAGLEGPLVAMIEPRHAGSEKLGDRLTHKVTGAVRLNHWSDNVRMTMIWIDAESLLIRKVFEDTPSGQGGAVQRVTTVFEPVRDVKLENAQFQFAPPPAS
jgi:hypothetical protein